MPQLVELTLSDDKIVDIIAYLSDKLQQTVKARSTQIDENYRRWQDNYSAKPKEKVRTTPWLGASNFIPQLIRMHTDILAARIYSFLVAPKPFWRPATLLGQSPTQYLEALGMWLDYECFHKMHMHKLLYQLIFRTVKFGTVVLKAPWIKDEWMSVEGVGEDGNYQEKSHIAEGIEARAIPHDDFFPYPITAGEMYEVQIKFHRLRFTKEEVVARRDRGAGAWIKKATDLLLTSEDDPSSRAAHSSQAEQAGIQLTKDVDRPYSAIEAWLEYPLQGSGKLYRIVITFNPAITGKDSLLRAYFNPYSTRIDPFVKFGILPREDLFYNYSIPEILEQSQEEQAQIHNTRRDASTISNIPGWKKLRTANIPDPSKAWYPSKVWELEEMDELEMIQFQPRYQSMVEEEKFVCDLAERYSGVSPPMQGMGAGVMSGKRGIYNTGGTLALLSEGNRRIDIYKMLLREDFHNFGNLIYVSHRDNRPSGLEYDVMGKNGELVKQLFKFREPDGYSGLFFDIAASEASANNEVDRTGLMMVANVMASYYQRMVEVANVIIQLPKDSPMVGIMSSVVEGARDLANRLLAAFNQHDRDKLVPDMLAILKGKPAGNPQGMEQNGLPESEGPVSVDNLAALAQQLSSITPGVTPTNGGGQNVGGA